MHLSALHQQSAPLLIANVGDVPSARAAHAAGYQVIGTSSAAVSDAFGYPDGEGSPLPSSRSMRHFVHNQMQDRLRRKFQMIQSQQSFDAVFAHASH